VMGDESGQCPIKACRTDTHKGHGGLVGPAAP
jgi:hypothetical protein